MKLPHLLALLVLPLQAGATTLNYSTYLSANGDDLIRAITVDTAGNVYLTGETWSSNFPVTPGAFQSQHAGQPGTVSGVFTFPPPAPDAFVVKINPQGQVVYATYLGGSNADSGRGIAVDSDGSAYIVGTTASPNFPLAGNTGSDTDVFIAKLNPAGSRVTYSMVLATPGFDSASAIAVNSAGSAFVLGTSSTGPFISKVNPGGTALIYSKSLGGSSNDSGGALAIDSTGNAYATGTTSLAGGAQGAFVVKLNATGSNIISSTTLGSHGSTIGTGIALDSQGNIYIAGSTNSPDFQKTVNGSSDAFVARLNPDTLSILYTSLVGGSGAETAWGLAIDANGNPLIGGRTDSNDFPVTADAEPKRFAGSPCLVTSGTPFGNPPIVIPCGDAFVARLNAAGTALTYSTYLSGSDEDAAFAIALSPGGAVYVAGSSRSDNFPTAGTPISDTRTPVTCSIVNSPSSSQSYACYDGFLSRIDFNAIAPTPALRVVNFGHLLTTPVAPAEVVTLFGAGIGPAAPATLQLGSNNRITTSLSNTRVLFDGIAAPLIRVAADQITAIVPASVAGKAHSTVAVERNNQTVTSTTVVVGGVSPALLTLDPSGTGQCAAINLDGTINGLSNPTAAGSIVTLFAIGMSATGEPDGSLASAAAPLSPAPVVVVGGQLAQVLYAGPSPTMTSALTQINIRLPGELKGQLPVYVLTKGSSTQYGVTLSVN